ncbi:hypothetical protein [Mesobacterium pallidum]|uniref:hypothetical protein n=1 Tax=Mesobacterium pallidum TaxID=2872037 RepID=UPI001EE366FE|nr:hypothetical protein [Mesobacterium pallidum]
MPRGQPKKYIEGPPIETMGELADLIESGRYIIIRNTGQRVHPGWAGSWQLSMAMRAIRSRNLLRALDNPAREATT